MSNQPMDEPRRILVVDDEDVMRSILSRLLRSQGFEVTTACDGQEGLAVLAHAQQPFDLLVLDLIMPGLNGDLVLETIRDTDPRLPVIIYSGHADTDMCRHLVERGAAAVLEKRTPFPALVRTCTAAMAPTAARAS